MEDVFDAENYDKQFFAAAEAIDAYFIGVFYNNIYITASQNIKSSRSSLNSEYCRLITKYVMAFKTIDKVFESVTTKLYKFYQAKTKYSIVSFNSFVDHIVEFFVPVEYYGDLTPKDRDNLLNNILVDLVATLGVFITTPEMLRNVIDHHSTKFRETINIIQNHCLSYMQTKKEVIHNKFLQNRSEAKAVVSLDIVENMKNTIRTLLKEKIKYKTELEVKKR